jgi:uncharacterized protein YecT (DUF1311 family)
MKSIVYTLLLIGVAGPAISEDQASCVELKTNRDKVICSVAELKAVNQKVTSLYLKARHQHKGDPTLIDLVDQTKEFWDFQARQTCMARSANPETSGQYESLNCAVQQAHFRLADLKQYISDTNPYE